MFVHLTLVPYIPSAGELKTKPTQHSVKELLNVGIQPHMLLCRCDRPIPENERRKIALFCNVRPAGGDRGARRRHDLRGADQLSRRGHGPRSAAAFRPAVRDRRRTCRPGSASSTSCARRRARCGSRWSANTPTCSTAIRSLAEALAHGGIANRVRVRLDWVDSQMFEHAGRGGAAGGRARHPGARRLRRARHARARSRRCGSRASGACRSSASASACRWR